MALKKLIYDASSDFLSYDSLTSIELKSYTRYGVSNLRPRAGGYLFGLTSDNGVKGADDSFPYDST